MRTIHDLNEYESLVLNSPALLSYFSTENCSVCKVLKPKVTGLVNERFPEMSMAWIDIEKFRVIAGQNRIFTAPTLLVYFDGRETLRKSRNISLAELEKEISRIYDLMFKG
jgi:hypothetical protein